MKAKILDTERIRDISPEVLGPDGRLKVLPASYWKTTTTEERALFGHRHAIYQFPTEELVARLLEIIDGRAAIEIGAGSGVLAQALGIPGTDSHQQSQPKVKMWYELHGQPTITYGPNVLQLEASEAVRHFKPDVVIGCWITHKWDDAQPQLEGNAWGVDQADVLRHCQQYVKIGNEQTHRVDPLWERAHKVEYPDYLFSRAHSSAREWLATWQGSKAA